MSSGIPYKGYPTLTKASQSISHRPLSFYDKNKAALLTSAILALIGGTGGALSGKKRKSRIWRGILGAILGGAAGAGVGHLYDTKALKSRIEDKARKITENDIKDAYTLLKGLQTDAQYDYMHRHGGTPAKSLKELGNGWEIGSYGSNIDQNPVIARINDKDLPKVRYGFDEKQTRHALARPYRYGIVPFEGGKRTPVAIALPEYDMDEGPGIVHVMPIKKDPSDFYKPTKDLVKHVSTPEGKAALRDLVMHGKPITKAILEQLK